MRDALKALAGPSLQPVSVREDAVWTWGRVSEVIFGGPLAIFSDITSHDMIGFQPGGISGVRRASGTGTILTC